jgi:hypothetical protein
MSVSGPQLCPAGGSPTLQPSTATGHHKVLLTWKASAPGARPEDNTVGYCLYRSLKKDVAKSNATCSACEQINSVPVTGTACVDDLVQDGALYYYVVTAMNAAGNRSSSSNEIPVAIPGANVTTGSSVGANSACREALPSR